MTRVKVRREAGSQENVTPSRAMVRKATRMALVVVPLCALAAAGGCKKDGSSEEGGSEVKAHLGGPRMTGLLQLTKARMGLFKAVGTQFCPSGETLVEYHVKELENHSAFNSPLWGVVCIAKGARTARLLDGQGTLLGHALRRQSGEKIFYEIGSEVGGACNLGDDAPNVLARVTVYEKGLLQKVLDWQYRELLGVCNHGAGRDLVPVAEFVRDFVSPAFFNENWHVVKSNEKDVHDRELAKIWTNPAWGSWSVENLQEGEAIVHPAVLYLLPAVQEMKRRESATEKTLTEKEPQ